MIVTGDDFLFVVAELLAVFELVAPAIQLPPGLDCSALGFDALRRDVPGG